MVTTTSSPPKKYLAILLDKFDQVFDAFEVTDVMHEIHVPKPLDPVSFVEIEDGTPPSFPTLSYWRFVLLPGVNDTGMGKRLIYRIKLETT